MVAYKQLEAMIRAWAEEEQAIRALVVVGSRARTEPPADAWSDLDLVLFATDPQAYVRDGSWLDQFGAVWLRLLQETGAGDPEWLVLFSGGYKVDFLLTTAVPVLAEALQGPAFGEVCRRGVRILLDKEGVGTPPLFEQAARSSTLDPTRFVSNTNAFWMTAYRTAGMIYRGDLWRARQMMDGELRRRLQTMLAWHAQSRQGNDRDTWYDGRFLQNWADPRAVAELPGLFAAYDRAGTARALRLLVKLYRMIAEETAAQKRYLYPDSGTNRVCDWIEVTLEEIT